MLPGRHNRSPTFKNFSLASRIPYLNQLVTICHPQSLHYLNTQVRKVVSDRRVWRSLCQTIKSDPQLPYFFLLRTHRCHQAIVGAVPPLRLRIAWIAVKNISYTKVVENRI